MTKLNPRVMAVVPEPDHRLLLTFTNGETKRFDLRPYLGTGLFAELLDESIFSTAKAALGTVVWENGLDLCPDTLYLEAELVGQLA